MAADLSARVGAKVLVLAADDLRDRLAACPFDPDAGKQLHGFFCFDDPVFDKAAYADLKATNEVVMVSGRTVWLLTPDGIGRSRLADKFHRVITGTTMTARNLNTIRALAEMLD